MNFPFFTRKETVARVAIGCEYMPNCLIAVWVKCVQVKVIDRRDAAYNSATERDLSGSALVSSDRRR